MLEAAVPHSRTGTGLGIESNRTVGPDKMRLGNVYNNRIGLLLMIPETNNRH